MSVLLVMGQHAVAWAQADDPTTGADTAPKNEDESLESQGASGDADEQPEQSESESARADDGEPDTTGASDSDAAGSGLRAPDLGALSLPNVSEGVADEDADGDDAKRAAALLEEVRPPGGDWSAPQPILTLHGYFRVRAELQDTFYLGRRPIDSDRTGLDWPFGRFRPGENGLVPIGGCGDSVESGAGSTACDSETLGFATMRLRLSPTISLSDDVRVHAMFDVFDNFVLGSSPDGFGGLTGGEARSIREGEDRISVGAAPPEGGRNSIQDAIRVRRAWGEVTNRGLGQLRFGRMGWHWGLGMFANGGEGLDSDFQTDVDRIMGIAQLFGLYLMASWDFADEGFVQSVRLDPYAMPYDAFQDDDVDQFMFAVAKRASAEEQEEALARGEVVLNAGGFFLYRDQLLSTRGIADRSGLVPADVMNTDTPTPVVRRNGEAFIPNLWVQFLWGGLRLELESALIVGLARQQTRQCPAPARVRIARPTAVRLGA